MRIVDPLLPFCSGKFRHAPGLTGEGDTKFAKYKPIRIETLRKFGGNTTETQWHLLVHCGSIGLSPPSQLIAQPIETTGDNRLVSNGEHE